MIQTGFSFVPPIGPQPGTAPPRPRKEQRKSKTTDSRRRSLVDKTSNPKATAEQVAKAVSRDPAIALKVLKLANSAVYSRTLHIDSVQQKPGRHGADPAGDPDPRQVIQAALAIKEFIKGMNEEIGRYRAVVDK